ncbi:beta-1,4-galactosyltransferase 2-like [Dreissena polymorpha]|uniref:beta-1,4-galactosyltransferase 2-like n=1 Tax=Dreissena polymorpha TaxID=45954 RepID=UPI0022655C24|nr:beta-1,4-galactosyltransferase 2-like [Dreissena polymorpha]
MADQIYSSNRKLHEDGDSLHYEYNTFDFLKDESALISSNERIRDGTRTVHKTEPCIIAADSLDGVWSKGGNISARDVYNVTSLRRVSAGGAYTPADCNPQEFVAVIIPYRNRRSNLRILLFYLHTFLQRQKIQYTIFVVELAYPTVFNRGILANVGYLTAKDIGRFTCYVIHDVDRLPTRDANLYRCSRQPHHLAVRSSKYGYALPYGHYIGGVIAFTPAQFEAINGFSNAYFGWGREDDDLRKRITSKGYTIERPDATVGVYEELPHPESDTANPNNPISYWTLWEQLEDLDFADDLALLSHTQQQMQEKSNMQEDNSARLGLTINRVLSQV